MARYRTECLPVIDEYYRKLMQDRDVHGNWCLDGPTLVYFIRNMSLYGLDEPKIVQATGDVIKVQPRDTEMYRINVPANTGRVLDGITENWTEWPQFNNVKGDLQYIPRTCNGTFFTKERRVRAHEFIEKMLECGKSAGIYNKMFLAFGNLLGYSLIGDILWNDDDIDINILADDIPQGQLRCYLNDCQKAGLCENRLHGPEMINGKYVWFSIGWKSPTNENGCKACNWFWFKHGGYYWHSKGLNWKDGGAAKGIPLSIFDGKLKEIYFGGNKIGAPRMIGSCLDWWYGDWMNERNCTSASTAILKIGDEKNQKTWSIDRK